MGGKTAIEKSSDGLLTSSHAFLTTIREANSYQLASVLLDDFKNLSENQAKKLIMTTQVQCAKQCDLCCMCDYVDLMLCCCALPMAQAREFSRFHPRLHDGGLGLLRSCLSHGLMGRSRFCAWRARWKSKILCFAVPTQPSHSIPHGPSQSL